MKSEKLPWWGVLVSVLVLIASPYVLLAQGGSFTIVSTYTIDDAEFQEGDIVSFNPETGTYSLSRKAEDESIFGIINQEPIVVFRTSTDGIPVSQFGETRVNVTTFNGSIKAGDYITTSRIPGKGQLFDGENGYVVGLALEPLNSDVSSTTVFVDEEELLAGSVAVLLNIGPFSGGDPTRQPGAAPAIIINDPVDVGKDTIGGGTVFRYIIATIFASVSLYLVFRNFGPNLRQGVISVGRNPLAKSTIQSMVTFNMLLILTISISALLVSLVIILLPV